MSAQRFNGKLKFGDKVTVDNKRDDKYEGIFGVDYKNGQCVILVGDERRRESIANVTKITGRFWKFLERFGIAVAIGVAEKKAGELIKKIKL